MNDSAPLRLAAMDLGTNSFHLIVADVMQNGRFRVLGREKDAVRLGEGINDMKHLGRSAMERAIAVLSRYAMIAESHGAEMRAVATSAIREARNQEELVARVREEIGLEIEVISGPEEARLIYLGALQALPIYQKRIVLVDIGGGSTEFLLGHAGRVEYANSIKVGAVRLTRQYFTARTLDAAAVEECRTALRGALHPIRRVLRPAQVEQIVGCSGTIQSMAAIIRAMTGEAVHSDAGGVTFTRKELTRAIDLLLEAKSVSRRREIAGLDASRADIIVAGALVLEAVFEALDARQMITSKYALREGVLLDTVRARAGAAAADAHLRDVRRTSVVHLGESCRYEATHAHYVARLALDLFDQTRALHSLGGTEREYLEAAALLHDIGYHISHAQHHLHAHYLIAHSELLGFTEREKNLIGNVARYHRRSHPKEKHESFMRLGAGDRAVVRTLAAILRVADGLDRRHKNIFHTLRCHDDGEKMRIELQQAQPGDHSLELWGADRRKDLFETVFHRSVVFEPVVAPDGVPTTSSRS